MFVLLKHSNNNCSWIYSYSLLLAVHCRLINPWNGNIYSHNVANALQAKQYSHLGVSSRHAYGIMTETNRFCVNNELC